MTFCFACFSACGPILPKGPVFGCTPSDNFYLKQATPPFSAPSVIFSRTLRFMPTEATLRPFATNRDLLSLRSDVQATPRLAQRRSRALVPHSFCPPLVLVSAGVVLA